MYKTKYVRPSQNVSVIGKAHDLRSVMTTELCG